MNKKVSSSAKRSNSVYESYFNLLYTRHREAITASLTRIKKNLSNSVLICVMIAITLALPLLLVIMLNNVNRVTHGLSNSARLSLYLKVGSDEQDVNNVIDKLRMNEGIAQIKYISAQEGLDSLAKNVGLNNVLQGLNQNPLPPVLEITPTMSYQTPEKLQALASQLGKISSVEQVQLDLVWIKRLFAIVHLLRKVVIGIALLLAAGVIVIVGNTIKFALERYKEEIDILRLIGASDAYIRRPFLYTGVCYGLGGIIAALLIIAIFFTFLANAMDNVASSFLTNISLHFFGFSQILLVCLLGAFLGLSGAWLVVNRYLRNG